MRKTKGLLIMTTRDLDSDEGMLLLRFRLLPPEQQKLLLQQLEELSGKEPETPTNTPTEQLK